VFFQSYVIHAMKLAACQKMYDALDESELPDLPTGRFIADDHGSQRIE